ncbi:hypothetical protein HK104_008918 [Borealophlyctis nickersoniae]|nr:hypothetical protein HK104_008918 [Borealophlyctis nickersoniae]
MLKAAILSLIAPLALALPQGSPVGPVDPLGQIAACPPLPPRATPATSVKDLRIDDIKAVAALGDSITAGAVAKGLKKKNLLALLPALEEDRGISFTMGGDAGAVTLPNLISRFQPNLVGQGKGDHPLTICYGLLCPAFQYQEYHELNAAQSAALVMNLDGQVDRVVARMKQTKGLDYNRDWKLMNIFIGSNDACLGCLDGISMPNPDQYEQMMRALFTKIRKQVPRVVVNVMQQFNVSQVWDLTHTDPWCASLRGIGLAFECSCAFLPGPQGPTTRKSMDTLTQNYNVRLLKLAAEFRADAATSPDGDSFALVVDPAFRAIAVSEWPLDYLSDVDCFHPSVKAHEAMAISVWNNLFRNSTTKQVGVSPGDPLVRHVYCPTPESRIQVV